MKSYIKDVKDFKQEELNEVGVDMVRQTASLMLWTMHISGYSDDELIKIFNQFVSLINTKEILGKELKSNELSSFYAKKLGIDLTRVCPRTSNNKKGEK